MLKGIRVSMASALITGAGAISCQGNAMASCGSMSLGVGNSSWSHTSHFQVQILQPLDKIYGTPSNLRFKSMTSLSRHLATSSCASQEAPIELAKKKCIPCETKSLRPMSKESAETMIEQVPGWSIVEDEGKLRLTRAWKAKNFLKGLEFFQLVADVAEAEGHHPDLHLVSWNKLSIDIWTHAIGGLSENDFILAAKINAIHAEDLFRKLSHVGKEPSGST